MLYCIRFYLRNVHLNNVAPPNCHQTHNCSIATHKTLTIAPQSFNCSRKGNQYYRAKIGRHCKTNL